MTKWKCVDIDEVPPGTMVYASPGVPLGVVRTYLQMNGNRAALARRHLDNGNPKDRFAYRRESLYTLAKMRGMVMVKCPPSA